MKILQTNSFLKLSSDIKTDPGFKEPGDKNGPIDVLDNEGDSVEEIENIWKKKKEKSSRMKLPYLIKNKQ